MSRFLVISISLICAVLSGAVAKLSYDAAKTKNDAPQVEVVEKVKVEIEADSITCSKLLKEKPLKSTNLELTSFNFGKHFATRDVDLDKNWEMVVVPLFSKKVRSLKSNYRSVIVIFEDVKNRTELLNFLEADGLDANFTPASKLPEDIYSQLARKYESMDFKNCVVMYAGFEDHANASAIPVEIELGQSSLLISLFVCGLSILIIMFSLITWFLSSRQRKADAKFAQKEVSNRAGLPSIGNEDADSVDGEPQTITELLERAQKL